MKYCNNLNLNDEARKEGREVIQRKDVSSIPPSSLHHLSSLPNYPPPSSVAFPPIFPQLGKEGPPPLQLKIPFHQDINSQSDSEEVSRPKASSPLVIPKSQLEGALTRPLAGRDKDLADIPSIITMAQGFTGLPQEEISLAGNGPRLTGSPRVEIVEERPSNCSLEDEEHNSTPSKKMRYDEEIPFDDDPVIKEMKLKGVEVEPQEFHYLLL